jgi:ribosomal protein S18 acetylase RimI-like enzyme
MGPVTTLIELDETRFTEKIGAMLTVYSAAMRPGTQQLAGRRSIMAKHAGNPGFRALAVTDGSGELIAFTYGFHGAPGQWWHDMVSYALATSVGTSRAAEWMSDSFEIAELHVLPAHQGQGIGRNLLLRLAAGRAERTAVLSTHDTDSPARHLYRALGFTDLLTSFAFSGWDPLYAVMGARLPLPGSRS